MCALTHLGKISYNVLPKTASAHDINQQLRRKIVKTESIGCKGCGKSITVNCLISRRYVILIEEHANCEFNGGSLSFTWDNDKGTVTNIQFTAPMKPVHQQQRQSNLLQTFRH